MVQQQHELRQKSERPRKRLFLSVGPRQRAAGEAVRQGEAAKAFSFFAIGVQGANMETLGKLSAARPPMSLQGLKFRELFAWLSTSMKQVSKSSVGSDIPLPSTAGWGSVST